MLNFHVALNAIVILITVKYISFFMAVPLMTIVVTAIIGVIYSLLLYATGKFTDASDSGKNTVYNAAKMILIAVAGGLLAGYLAYTGVPITPDSLGALLSTLTFGGFGVIFVVDMIATFLANIIIPKSSIAKPFAMKV